MRSKLERFGGRITRVEAHLSDVNAGKPGDSDKRCVMEARVAGQQSTSVDARAPSVELAIDAAADKLLHALDALFGKRESARRGTARANRDEPL